LFHLDWKFDIRKNTKKLKLPFTIEQFLEVFKVYNRAVFPIQILLYIMAFTAILFVIKKTSYSGKLISLILSLFWLWMGIIYHIIYFSAINKAALLFGGLFVLQGIVFFVTGVLKGNLPFKFKKDVFGITGAILILFALIIYPLLSYINGHVYPASPTFGLPCPTTIFTLGLLCWVDKKLSPQIWAIPILWSVIGFMAAFSLGLKEDIGLFIAGILTVIFLVVKRKNIPLTR